MFFLVYRQNVFFFGAQRGKVGRRIVTGDRFRQRPFELEVLMGVAGVVEKRIGGWLFLVGNRKNISEIDR